MRWLSFSTILGVTMSTMTQGAAMAPPENDGNYTIHVVNARYSDGSMPDVRRQEVESWLQETDKVLKEATGGFTNFELQWHDEILDTKYGCSDIAGLSAEFSERYGKTIDDIEDNHKWIVLTNKKEGCPGGTAWVGRGLGMVSSFDSSVTFAHELFHQFGASHSNSLYLEDSVEETGAEGEEVIITEYGDDIDVMGSAHGRKIASLTADMVSDMGFIPNTKYIESGPVALRDNGKNPTYIYDDKKTNYRYYVYARGITGVNGEFFKSAYSTEEFDRPIPGVFVKRRDMSSPNKETLLLKLGDSGRKNNKSPESSKFEAPKGEIISLAEGRLEFTVDIIDIREGIYEVNFITVAND